VTMVSFALWIIQSTSCLSKARLFTAWIIQHAQGHSHLIQLIINSSLFCCVITMRKCFISFTHWLCLVKASLPICNRRASLRWVLLF
jgi:hypothetical protein